jgi:hypothetical protein
VYEVRWTEFKVAYCFADADHSTHKACLFGIALDGGANEWRMIRFAVGDSREAAGMRLLNDVAVLFAELDGVRAGTEGQSICEVATMKRGRESVAPAMGGRDGVLTSVALEGV